MYRLYYVHTVILLSIDAMNTRRKVIWYLVSSKGKKWRIRAISHNPTLPPLSIKHSCRTHPEDGPAVLIQSCGTHSSRWRLPSDDASRPLPHCCWGRLNAASISPVHPNSRDNCRTWLWGSLNNQAFKQKLNLVISLCKENTQICDRNTESI